MEEATMEPGAIDATEETETSEENQQELRQLVFKLTIAVLYAVGASVGSTTVSGVGLSTGKAMDSGTMSLSGVVAWSGDSGSLFMELSGAF
ncbi:hypothetical protein F2Q70_00003568 [Brassica cretica]|uniref:Uncharacterized protein n=1 Tax=Brassica cretica TaxID=69181 RepID=A0A8S9IRD4_BRACR|nr:hypothetical protein F2Q70_00003568 [Brassica cretica]